MERVYKSINEVEDNLKFVPVFDSSELRLDVYLEGRKVGRIDKHNKKIRVKVKVADKKKLPTYRGDKPFSISAAVYHYFEGSGKPVTVDSAEVDIGLKPDDFRDYRDLLKSMYRKNETIDVGVKEAKYVGGWAGNVTFGLKGTVKSATHKWEFSGHIWAYNDKFDFDKKEWGVRKHWAEVVTRMVGALPAGKEYKIKFEGKREVTDRGRW